MPDGIFTLRARTPTAIILTMTSALSIRIAVKRSANLTEWALLFNTQTLNRPIRIVAGRIIVFLLMRFSDKHL